MTYFRKASSWKYPANAARTHARACRRVMATAASYSRPLSLTTFAVSSSSAIVSTTPRMNARRRFGGIESMNARPQIIMIVSSADGPGMSPDSDGGNATRSPIDTTPAHHAPPGAVPSCVGQPTYSNAFCKFTVQQKSRMAFAVGPAVEPPPARVLPGHPFPHVKKTGVLSPGPLHQFLNCCGLPSPLPCKAEKRSAQIREVNCGAFVALRRLQVVPRRDLASPSKVYPDHFAHVVRSKCAPRLEASQ